MNAPRCWPTSSTPCCAPSRGPPGDRTSMACATSKDGCAAGRGRTRSWTVRRPGVAPYEGQGLLDLALVKVHRTRIPELGDRRGAAPAPGAGFPAPRLGGSSPHLGGALETARVVELQRHLERPGGDSRSVALDLSYQQVDVRTRARTGGRVAPPARPAHGGERRPPAPGGRSRSSGRPRAGPRRPAPGSAAAPRRRPCACLAGDAQVRLVVQGVFFQVEQQASERLPAPAGAEVLVASLSPLDSPAGKDLPHPACDGAALPASRQTGPHSFDTGPTTATSPPPPPSTPGWPRPRRREGERLGIYHFEEPSPMSTRTTSSPATAPRLRTRRTGRNDGRRPGPGAGRRPRPPASAAVRSQEGAFPAPARGPGAGGASVSPARPAPRDCAPPAMRQDPRPRRTPPACLPGQHQGGHVLAVAPVPARARAPGRGDSTATELTPRVGAGGSPHSRP